MNSDSILKKIILAVIVSLLNIGAAMPLEAAWDLTQEERAYIAEKNILKAVSLDGAAPIQYTDGKGEIQGISKRLLEEISSRTGLIFEYEIYHSLDEAFASDFDVFFGMPVNYAMEGMVLSLPYLESETILYIRSSLNPNELEDKIYAAVRGSALPEGIEEKNAIFFDTREESLNAVESGKADYGYGNAYSVAFYTLQNNYKNIVSIPWGKESREYCMGFIKDNERLISIINKSIAAMDNSHRQRLILEETSRIDRKVTLSMMMYAHGKKILIAIFVFVGILLYSILSHIRINNELRRQNRQHEILSQISNEYLYEYFPKTDRLELSGECARLFGESGTFNKASKILRAHLLNKNADECILMLKLPLANGEMGVFKTINLRNLDENGKLESIMGKLIDISEETAEKEKLITKAQEDGLTGLYNAVTAKKLIIERMKNRGVDETDVFILMDCDKFKEINDDFGHLTGNQILEHIGRSLKLIFRNHDIIGRIGGDEFCVYMPDISSMDLVRAKCHKLNKHIGKMANDLPVSISIGVAPSKGETEAYDDLFKRADEALYQAKRNGRAQVVCLE